MITNGPWHTLDEAVHVDCVDSNPDGSVSKCSARNCMAWRQLEIDGTIRGYCGKAGEPASKVAKGGGE